ncbi:MAG: polysaccharide biosynthesis protein [Oscillospiraceae bacterium]|nr:polysaccharide biosynthesis protein [Oscillospiraceae bacterium]
MICDNEKKNTRERVRFVERWQVVAAFLVVYDIITIHISYFVSLWSRFDFMFTRIESHYLDSYLSFITYYAVASVILFWMFRLYRSIWQFASYPELIRIIIASALASIVHSVVITVFFERMPLIYYFGGALLQMVFLIASRFSRRLILFGKTRYKSGYGQRKRVMLIGAGAAGQMIIRDINTNTDSEDVVVCAIDDDSNKWNRFIDDIPIVGGRDDILVNVEKYKVDKIYIVIPSADAEDRRDILNICSETDCELKQLPSIYQLITGQVSAGELRDVSVEDLLGRKPIDVDLNEVFQFINGKTVLVTGGGGSIGSELCRQISNHGPKQLIIVDIYENNAYDIQIELKEKHPELDLVVLIGSVRDSRRMFEIFEKHRPEIVYHAAAHKHVPLMEESPCEAIKNNVLGTYKTAYAAMVHGCKRFVLISTDKAVNPTNIMGASKRLCEMVIQSFSSKIMEGKASEIPQLFTHEGIENADKDGSGKVFQDIDTEFVAVRFGNVLGSNGSVIPLFKRQIANGGPVTVTHPDIIRYFMTIPEAVSLVMLAGTYAKGGEIFVLDMGSPVKIDTLAKNLIKLSGYRPNVDIMIEYTGLRPGEKLYEEKLMAEEGLRKTENELIHIGNPIEFDADSFFSSLKKLMDMSYANDSDIKKQVAAVVSTYHPKQDDLGQ